MAATSFLQQIQAKGELLARGHEAGMAQAVPGLRPQGILFAGMGGSGATALLVRDAASGVLDQPLTITQNYGVPHHVKPAWHVLAVSYSGETEETLAAVREARRRGCSVTAFTTGGTLRDLAHRSVLQPTGFQPRVALAHAWFSVLGFLEGSDLLPQAVPVEAALAAVRGVDAACGPDVDEAQNDAKQLARRLHARIPQIYTTAAFAGIGTFFASLLNENAKKIADVDEIPECNHNALTGWSGDPKRDQFTVLVLSDRDQHPDLARRIAFMQGRYTSWGVQWTHRESGSTRTFGEHVVEQARALQFLDYVSYYCAVLRGVDPTEIEAVVGLKAFLRQARAAEEAPPSVAVDAAPSQGPRPKRPRLRPKAGATRLQFHGSQPGAAQGIGPGAAPRPRTLAAVGNVLRILQGRRPMTKADIRLASGLSPRTVYSALRALCENGVLRVQPSLRDARQAYYWLAEPAPPTPPVAPSSPP